MRIELVAPAATIEATDTDARVMRGIAVPYGVPGRTSAGKVTIDAGAVRVPTNLRYVKLFREHGREVPIGYALDASDESDALRMGFTVARTDDGDRALLEASEGLRDAFSVELDNVQIRAGHVVAADLVAVAQVAVPAFAAAQLNASDTPEPDPDPNPDDEDPDADPAPEDDDETKETTVTVSETTTEASAPSGLTAAMTPRPIAAETAGSSLELFAAAAASRIRAGQGTTAELEAALNDIVPANTADPGGAFLRPGWLGELWSASKTERPFADMIGLSSLTSATFEGWQWTLKPVVSHYAGNKTPVPSSPATAGLVQSGPPQRVAGAWDIDRIYFDFNTGMLTSFFAGAVGSYNEILEADLAALIETTATPLADSTSLLDAVGNVVGALFSVGAKADYIALAPDLFAAFIALPEGEVPWWLQKQGVVSFANGGSADVADLKIGVANIPAGTVLAGDKRAVDARATGPIRVEAVNIPSGGIDLGLFGYLNSITNDARAVVKTLVVPPVVPLEAKATKAAKS